MIRFMDGLGYYAAAVFALVLCVSHLGAAEITATWTGGGDNDLYSNPANWDIGVVPVNVGVEVYHAVIPTGFAVDFNLPGEPELARFSAAAGSTFTMLTGTRLAVTGETLLNGRLVGASGVFTAPAAPLTQSTSGAATFSVLGGSRLTVPFGTYRATAAYRENWDGAGYHRELLRSSGNGSLLDFSAAEVIDARYNDSSANANAYEIIAEDGGAIDFSSLTHITNPLRGEDCLRFVLSGGTIDLSALETIPRLFSAPGYTEFDIGPTSTVALPSMKTAGHVHFVLRNSTAGLLLPSLEAYTGGTVTLLPDASLTAEVLTAMDGVTVDFQGAGSVIAPSLTQFTNGSIVLDPSRTFTTAGLSSIDDSRIAVHGGRTFGASTGDITAKSYRARTAYRENWDGSRYHREVFRSSGAGSLLDLSKIATLDAGYDDNSANANAYQIIAEDGGRIDLSGLTTLHLPARSEDALAFIQRSAGTIDLSGLRYLRASGKGKVLFQVESGGLLRFGHMVDTQGAEFVLADPAARMEVEGTFFLEATAKLNASAGAEVAPKGDYFFKATDEARVVMDAAVLDIAGVGPSRIEVGGTDGGVLGFTAGNFGIGRLVLGGSGSPAFAGLIDLYDNGNRAGTGAEALYLYGLGGTEGLILEGGSVLTLNNLNVYAWSTAAGAMRHLNALFEPGQMRIPFDDGYLQLARMDVQWTNAAGGTFATGGNWDKGMPPAGSDSAAWNLGSAEGYTVTFASDAASDAAVIQSDTVTFDLAGHEYGLSGDNASYALVVGQTASDRARLTIENGTLRGRNALIGGAGGSGCLTVASGAVFTVEEDLVLGTGDATLRVLAGGCTRIGGDLYLGKSRLVDLDGGTIVVGTGTDAGSGDTLLVHEDASVLGAGIIGGNFACAGTIAPEADGAIHVTGDFSLAETSLLELTYSGPSQPKPTFDVTGAAALDGRLHLNFPAATPPPLGAEFVIMEYASASGAFDGVDGIYPYAQVGMRLLLGENRLSLIATLAGDFNGDGTVNSRDLDIVRANWGQTVGAGDWSAGDGSGDGKVGSTDLDLVRANWGATAAAAVPEPHAIAAIACTVTLLVSRRRRKPKSGR